MNRRFIGSTGHDAFPLEKQAFAAEAPRRKPHAAICFQRRRRIAYAGLIFERARQAPRELETR
jgi:hypothetical protein